VRGGVGCSRLAEKDEVDVTRAGKILDQRGGAQCTASD